MYHRLFGNNVPGHTTRAPPVGLITKNWLTNVEIKLDIDVVWPWTNPSKVIDVDFELNVEVLLLWLFDNIDCVDNELIFAFKPLTFKQESTT